MPAGKKSLDAAPGLIDIAYVGDDVASQMGMLFRPELWRRYFKSVYAKQFQIAKSRGVKVMFHICGACRDIIPDLIDIGLDILMPLQLSARGMDPVELKREFGNHLTFWGGVDVQSFLPYASPDEVRQEVRRLIDILGKEGGYVLSSSHTPAPPCSNPSTFTPIKSHMMNSDVVLATNDGSKDAPKLRVYLNLDNLDGLPAESLWPGLEGEARFARLAADGFHGVQLPGGQAEPPPAIRWPLVPPTASIPPPTRTT